MRTKEEIRERVGVMQATDPFGFGTADLRVYLPEELVEGATADEPPTPEQMRTEIAKYLPFAFGKALDHRGLSASRSVQHLRAWLWLGGYDGLLRFAEDEANYPNYGVPILKRVATELGLPVPDDIRDWPDGGPCDPDCAWGCWT